MTQPTPDTLRDRIRRAVCEAEGFAWDSDILEPDEYGEVADMVLTVRNEEMDRLRADLNTCRERYATSANNAMQELAARDTELVAARSTIDRVRAAADALATQAADFTSHHNPACECSWGEALDQAATRIRSALDPPQPTAPPAHLAKGTNAEDCPACCAGPTPDYPWICPGPEATL